MPHQVALTIRASIRPARPATSSAQLASMADPAANRAIPFERLGTTHFARLFVLDEVDAGPDDSAGASIPASLVYMSDIDAPVWRHLVALVRIGEPARRRLRPLRGLAVELGATWPRVAWLRARRIKTDIVYVNTVGRSVAQVHGERRLRQAVEEFLDGKQTEWHGSDPVSIHAAVRQFVAGRPDLRWALRPARGPGLAFRVRIQAQQGRWGAAGAALLAAVAGPSARPCCAATSGGRARPAHPAQPRRLRELADLEDHVVQNPLTAVGVAKPGRFEVPDHAGRVAAANYFTRHVFNHGSLARVRSIHLRAGWRSTTAAG